jgi:ABC-type transporter Mla MlaB component
MAQGSVTGVLKISDVGSDGDATLRLDGQVAGRWVEVLRRSCDLVLGRGARLTLDLSHVSFADHEGIVLLTSLIDRQVRLVNASPFMAEQMKRAAR